jgi:hypothetical protein
MKQHISLIIALTLGCIFTLWKSFDFQQTEEKHFNTTQYRLDSLQKCVLFFQENIGFCKKHKKEMLLFSNKGWIRPHSRLKIGRFLDKLRPPFRRLTYQCEPEETRESINHSFRVSRITIETESFQDGSLYQFLRILFAKFPGVLIAREINLTRSSEDSSYSLIYIKRSY